MTFSRDNELVNWAYTNPEAAEALLAGKAAVMSFKPVSERNMSGMAWRAAYEEMDRLRLDKPSNKSEDK